MKINKNEKNVIENNINNEPNINELINDIENFHFDNNNNKSRE